MDYSSSGGRHTNGRFVQRKGWVEHNGDLSVVVGSVCFEVLAKPTTTADMVKGFGCRQAYESLSCRNPRSAFSELWGFVYRSFRRAADRSDSYQSRRVESGVC